MPGRLLAPILRRQLLTSPLPSQPDSFILPLRKLLVAYSQHRPQHDGLRQWVDRDVREFARRNPGVEVVVKEGGTKGYLKGFYLNNNRVKVIDTARMPRNQVAQKVQLLLDSSGEKLKRLQRHPVVNGGEAPARGVYSGLHDSAKPRQHC